MKSPKPDEASPIEFCNDALEHLRVLEHKFFVTSSLIAASKEAILQSWAAIERLDQIGKMPTSRPRLTSGIGSPQPARP